MFAPVRRLFQGLIGRPQPAGPMIAARLTAPGLAPHHLHRVALTAACRDCDPIPKVRRAGAVFAGPGGRYQLMHNGLKVVADGYCGPWMTELIRRLDGHHEPQEEAVFDAILKRLPPGGTAVELGSYWAYYALWFLKAGGGRAVCVEPDPNHLAVGKRNFALNGFSADFVQASVGGDDLPPRAFRCESDGVTRAVPEVCVDHLLDRLYVPRADLLLADIQGAELRMLDGAERMIAAGRVRFLVLSTHHRSISGDPYTHLRCLWRVRELGGRVICEHSVGESFSGDGLIVASFDPADAAMPTVHVSKNTPANSLFGEDDRAGLFHELAAA
jgi:FkbM family methyltransferase